MAFTPTSECGAKKQSTNYIITSSPKHLDDITVTGLSKKMPQHLKKPNNNINSIQEASLVNDKTLKIITISTSNFFQKIKLLFVNGTSVLELFYAGHFHATQSAQKKK